jgi:hypothetical protein
LSDGSIVQFHVFLQRNIAYPSRQIRLLKPEGEASTCISDWVSQVVPRRIYRANTLSVTSLPTISEHESNPPGYPVPLIPLAELELPAQYHDPITQDPFVDATQSIVRLACPEAIPHHVTLESVEQILAAARARSTPSHTVQPQCPLCRTVIVEGSWSPAPNVVADTRQWLMNHQMYLVQNLHLVDDDAQFRTAVVDFLTANVAWRNAPENQAYLKQQIQMVPTRSQYLRQFILGGGHKLKRSKRQLDKKNKKISQIISQNKTQKRIQKTSTKNIQKRSQRRY